MEIRDVTTYARAVVQLVEEVAVNDNITLIQCVDIFRGSKAKKVTCASFHETDLKLFSQITDKGHQNAAQHGAGSDMERGDVERLFQHLCALQVLTERAETNKAGYVSYCAPIAPV